MARFLFEKSNIPEVNIDGYHTEYLPSLLNQLYEDFILDKKLTNEPLELFKDDNSEIINFINQSVYKSTTFIVDKCISESC